MEKREQAQAIANEILKVDPKTAKEKIKQLELITCNEDLELIDYYFLALGNLASNPETEVSEVWQILEKLDEHKLKTKRTYEQYLRVVFVLTHRASYPERMSLVSKLPDANLNQLSPLIDNLKFSSQIENSLLWFYVNSVFNLLFDASLVECEELMLRFDKLDLTNEVVLAAYANSISYLGNSKQNDSYETKTKKIVQSLEVLEKLDFKNLTVLRRYSSNACYGIEFGYVLVQRESNICGVKRMETNGGKSAIHWLV
jgi:hypothetical protein